MSENYVVAICTLGENPNISECVSKLLEIKEISSCNLKIMIVLNRVSSGLIFDSRVEVVYQPKRGYSNVRNSAVDNTPKNFNLIFIDDDEIPTLKWFEALVATHQVFPSDLIFGPVLAEPEIGSISYRDKFKSKFDSLPDGALVKQAGAGNMLIPSYLLDSKLVSFDSFFNESGSEDTDLCFRLRKKGFKIRYSKGAEIFELQGRERVSAQYMKSRELKDVCNYSLVIRRNCGIFAISWRILTLSLRVLWFSALSLHSKNHKFQRTLFLKSLQALVRGRLD